MTLAWQNYRWAEALIHTLTVSGVQHFFIAPGSRNAPLSMACLRLAKQIDIRCHIHFDERSLAFAALGASKASTQPTVVITTSGSAVANLLPATVEASQLNIPLILLTADRPEELIDVGANQAIRQPGLFSTFVRWQTELALPADDGVESSLKELAQQLVDSLTSDPGSIHLNVPLREPLYADFFNPDDHYPSWPVVAKPTAKATLITAKPITGLAAPTVLVAGQLSLAEADVVLAIAEQHQLPLLADIGSQLRLLEHPLIVQAAHYLAQTNGLDNVASIVQFGGRLTSKAINQWLETTPVPRYLISRHSQRLDPAGTAKPLQAGCEQWQRLCTNLSVDITSKTSSYGAELMATGRELSRKVSNLTEESTSEYSVAQAISKAIPSDHALMLGNSLTIRLFDLVATQRRQAPVVFSNRGASGIDGLIATSTGIALAAMQPVTAVVGDVSALYDLNSLALLRQLDQTFVLVILNNDGGQIFSMLPAAQQTDVFDDAFAQPHGLTFDAFCTGFGLRYKRAETLADFKQQYSAACNIHGPTVLEVTLPNHAAVQHQALIQGRLYD